MNEDWLDAIGCPACQNGLYYVNGSHSALVCQSCGRHYAIQDRAPVLLRREDQEVLTEFNRMYQRMRLSEGWRPLTAEDLLKLPFAKPPGYPALYWEVRRQSYAALKSWLAEQGLSPSMGPVADVGAGNGWLSYNLARLGYRVVAFDSNIAEPFGLDAARIYLTQTAFLVVQGDLNRPPLQAGKFSLVLFNASLHYSRDLSSALRRAERALLPKGRIVIMDSPVTETPQPGTGIGDRQFGRRELEDLLEAIGLRVQWIPVQRGPSWWIQRALRRARGSPPISFPILIAEREVVDPEIKLSEYINNI